jgi:hypothetical protein
VAAHSPHPGAERVHDIAGPEPILYDDCERCVEHSRSLLDLDEDFIVALARKMLSVERTDDGRYRSDAEARACRRLHEMLLLRGRNPELRALIP